MDLRFTESGFEEKLKGFTCHVQGCGKEYDRACELALHQKSHLKEKLAVHENINKLEARESNLMNEKVTLNIKSLEKNVSKIFPPIEPTGNPVASVSKNDAPLEDLLAKNPYHPYETSLEKKIGGLLFDKPAPYVKEWLTVFTDELKIPNFNLKSKKDISTKLNSLNKDGFREVDITDDFTEADQPLKFQMKDMHGKQSKPH